jgi:hypothetical protein
VSLKTFLLMFLLLLAPTTINETKGTLVMLPIGLMVAFVVAAKPGHALRRVVTSLALFAVVLAIFIPVYNALNEQREYGVTIGQFFTDPKNIERYLSSDKEVGAQGEVGRVDAVVVPTQQVAADPVNFAFGFGIGNASDSALGTAYSGLYADRYKNFLGTTYSRYILEVGAVGVALVLLVYLLVFQDARAVARADQGLLGAMAAGWTGVCVVMVLGSVYSKVEVSSTLNFLFWFYSGLIMAARVRIARAAEQGAGEPAAADDAVAAAH